jgi:DNA-binding response OmpR family regulator
VLIIDASFAVRHLAKVVLEQKHMLVFTFADNDQALQWLEKGVCKPHIMLIDIDLPIERWFLVTHYVRSQAASPSATIIALSCKEGLPEQEREVRTGIRWSLTKPFSPHELFAIVQHSLLGMISQ